MSTTKADQRSGGALDGVKWFFTVALIAGGVVGNAYFADESLLYRVLALVAIALVAAAIAVQTTQGRAFWELLKEARVEIRKVVWPTREETTQTTLIVLALVVVVALILWGLDSLLGLIVSGVIG